MPIEASRIEQGVYLSRWTGSVTVDELLKSQQEGRRLRAEEGDSRFVLVVDMTAVRHFPADVRALRAVADQEIGVLRMLLVGAPAFGRLLSDTLGKLSARFALIEYYDTREAAVTRARALLAKS